MEHNPLGFVVHMITAAQGIDLRGDGSSQRNGTVKGLSQGLNVIVNDLRCNEKICGKALFK